MSLTRPKTAKIIKNSNSEFSKEIQFLQQQKVIAYGGNMAELPGIFQKNPAFLVLETELQAELFNARCHDTGETVTIERAKVFKEEWNKMNSKKHPEIINLASMRLGVNTIITLATQLQNSKLFVIIVKFNSFTTLNLADNSISDYGMHAIKQIIANPRIKNLNLASNMISDSGLEMILEEIAKNKALKNLDLGVLEGSIKKNSFGVDGAKCIAAIILQNKTLESIKLQDNDIGSTGGEIIGTALKSNKTLKHLKISQNDLKNQGVEYILKSGTLLESLDISKNQIKHQIGVSLKSFMEQNQVLKRLNLEQIHKHIKFVNRFNEIGLSGIEQLSYGLASSQTLQVLNLRGNSIRDEGLQMLSQAILENESLEELDLSLNDLSPYGICYLAEVLPTSQIKALNLSKNLLGDESLILIANKMMQFKDECRLERLDVSSSRMADKGVLHFLEQIEEQSRMICIKASDNYISEKAEKILLEVLEKNKYLIEFNVQGNRLSLCCLNRISKITHRNQKILEEREPNKIRTEIYRLKYEQKKIMMAREKLQQQEKEILQIEDQKNKIISEMEKIRMQEQTKRQGFQDRIDEHKLLIEKKKKIIEEKVTEFERTKLQKSMEIESLKGDYEKSFKKRQELESEFQRLQDQLDQMEGSYKNQISTLEENIQNMKQKTEEIELKTTQLNEEYRLMMRKEQEIAEAEKQQLDKQQQGQETNQKDQKKKNKKAIQQQS